MSLPYFEINGGPRLRGTVRVSGAKNAALPIMAAAILCEGEVVLHDVPRVADVLSLVELLVKLGVEAEWRTDGALRLIVRDEMNCRAEYDIVRKMRASICVLGPLLAKRHRAQVSMPGGCAIGDRPVDLHIRAIKLLGADVELLNGDICAKVKRLRGTEMFLGGPFGSTVLGTANAMMAATLAEGVTVIEMAACEPEVVDLANFLNRCGASIQGHGTPRIVIEGVRELHGCEYRIIPDRIETGTLMVAAAITNGEMTLENVRLDHLMAFVDRMTAIGVNIEKLKSAPAPSRDRQGAIAFDRERQGESAAEPRPVASDRFGPDKSGGMSDRLGGGSEKIAQAEKYGAQVDRPAGGIIVSSARRLEPVDVTTQPFPGFPTDLQAQLMTLLCLADGNSIVTEKIFPDRFMHVAELSRMGAHLRKEGPTVIVEGVKRLVGAPVMASDLRASAALVLAGLAARGTTRVHRIYHLLRGYDRFDDKLRSVGADITRKEGGEE